MGLLNRKSNEYDASTEHDPLTGHHQAYNAGGVPNTRILPHTSPSASAPNPYANGNAVVGETERNGYGGILHGNKHKHGRQHGNVNNGPLGGGGGRGAAGTYATGGTGGHGGYEQIHAGPGTGTGMGTGTGGFGRHDASAPPPIAGSGHVNTGPAPLHGVSAGTGGSAATPSVKEAHKLERKGKMESTVGSLLCNSSLKHKSEAHLAQADHMRMQASELSEAERLEHEAGMRRQRAVGLGADPVHAQGVTGHGPHGARAA
ncbi:hypothetical protein IAU59_006990 [Kwoniella sp. CBS 9459]